MARGTGFVLPTHQTVTYGSPEGRKNICVVDIRRLLEEGGYRRYLWGGEGGTPKCNLI